MGLSKTTKEKIKTTANSSYPKEEGQRLNQALCPQQADLCLVESKLLRNRHLQVTAELCDTTLKKNNKYKQQWDYLTF